MTDDRRKRSLRSEPHHPQVGRKRFEAIVADAEEGVVFLDPGAVIGYANAAAEFLLGRGPTELVGEKFDLPSVPSHQPIHVNVISRDDRLRLVELRIEPLTDGPEGTLLLRLKDVTAYHQSVSEARNETRQRDEFLAMLSHELRNPLAAIQSSAVLLAKDNLGPQSRREASAVLNRQFGHLTRILDDLLDVTRVLRGKLSIVSERVALHRVLTDAVEAVSSLITQRGHRFTADLPEQEMWVWGNPTRLEQIVVNLLVNAIKFTPHGGKITLCAAQQATEVEITVRDNGPGIPAELLPRIFDPFVQGAQTLARSDGGLGIGLMLVRTFVHLHGGSIDVCANDDGCGVTFSVRLPLIACESKLSEQAADQVTNSLRVLLVEDSDDARLMLRMLLEDDGHHVIEAADGLSGLNAVLERRPDVALIDIGLPAMDGYELARRVRREAEGTPPHMIALTGYGTPEDVQRALDAGFDDHLVKPVNLPELLRRLETCRLERAGSRTNGGV
ncbi:Autoinducer 2 sensor kinase/phosphatase LuxQ [Anatilimnocola aggregata]|uniref:histidine kinase n=1 Tax=Anatilimnocola aggregata TaxID=2528021 RepID=A0A517YA17_9BACT|nr:ATP-binding protein [Anatilimnocola aggregata]QDU27058.1 Autoinducer 2 sensor kinase/phosphatase LuxQ [Anatilimnocola aggregata]